MNFKEIMSQEFPSSISFNLGQYVENFTYWSIDTFGTVFDAISSALLTVLLYIEKFLLFMPWWMVMIIILLVSWKVLNLKSGVFFAASLFLIGSFGYWTLMMYTLSIVVAAVIVSLLLGIPIGILMAYNNTFQTIMQPILDTMQTMPSFIYLIPAMMIFGMGMVPAVFATTIYSIPPVIRLTDLAIRKVSTEMVEAALSFGASSWCVLTKVQLPQALPTIMAGINQTTMMALSMVVIASMIGVKGLGMEVLISINRMDIARGFEAGLGIVILAIIIDRLSQGIAAHYKVPE
ncbi:MAG: glycine betaine/proline transport system permease protein [Clostridium sp.]|jgi:glycine betaine/proline transport system permease protein